MLLWTIQPEEVYNEIQTTGVYRCDIRRGSLPEFVDKYDWLVREMKARIGEPPAGVTYPVWAWYQWEGTRKKPDLRRERWGYGPKGDRYVCLEVDIPDQDVVLTDFDAWGMILNDCLISDTEEEDTELETEYNALDADARERMKDANWQRVFDITPFENGWIVRGDSIQATFWELRREEIRKVRRFTAAAS